MKAADTEKVIIAIYDERMNSRQEHYVRYVRSVSFMHGDIRVTHDRKKAKKYIRHSKAFQNDLSLAMRIFAWGYIVRVERA